MSRVSSRRDVDDGDLDGRRLRSFELLLGVDVEKNFNLVGRESSRLRDEEVGYGHADEAHGCVRPQSSVQVHGVLKVQEGLGDDEGAEPRQRSRDWAHDAAVPLRDQLADDDARDGAQTQAVGHQVQEDRSQGHPTQRGRRLKVLVVVEVQTQARQTQSHHQLQSETYAFY